MFTDKEKLAFIEVYMNKNSQVDIQKGVDLHQKFAQLLGIDRQDAKVLCHKMNYVFNAKVF